MPWSAPTRAAGPSCSTRHRTPTSTSSGPTSCRHDDRPGPLRAHRHGRREPGGQPSPLSADVPRPQADRLPPEGRVDGRLAPSRRPLHRDRPVNLARITHDAQQAIAFADGYEEASATIAAVILAEGGPAVEMGGVARRVRSLAYDALSLTAEVEAWRASREHMQPRLWEVP